MFATGRIAAIHREHTKDEIRKSIKELQEERANIKRTHEVGTIDELTLALEDGDDSWGTSHAGTKSSRTSRSHRPRSHSTGSTPTTTTLPQCVPRSQKQSISTSQALRVVYKRAEPSNLI